MSKKLRIVIAQLNLTVGDLQGNVAKHIAAATTARDTMQADVIVFPELSLTGYPPEDLLNRESFLQDTNAALNELKEKITGIHCVIGHPHPNHKGLMNACSVIYNGTILGRYAKQYLPNYGVFDERRYFEPGESYGVINIHDIPVGIVICEDLWHKSPVQQAANQGARIILSPNASPFEIDKQQRRAEMLSKRAKAANIPIVYVNQVGGQDELVFDGGSMVADSHGTIYQHAGFFEENLLPVDIQLTPNEARLQTIPFNLPSDDKNIYDCLVLGVRDYIHKNRIPGVIVAVSGGIDSALTLAIAVDAIGKEHVRAIMMPSRYTADISVEDADQLVKNLGVAHDTFSIEDAFSSFLTTLAPALGDKKADVVEQNIQARCRGVIQMAIANQTGSIVLTTGNRSEMAVGYATLFGDMAGSFAVLKDVPKTRVYRLAHYRNTIAPVIPERIITRPPTAELAFDQKDEDTLPPYPILDPILALYLNQAQSVDAICAAGFDRATVEKVIRMVHFSEYKRRQAPIGPRIDHTAFGRDRRYPITSGYKK
jgi:NAD+ synthase (glutamine-hydrolysing)